MEYYIYSEDYFSIKYKNNKYKILKDIKNKKQLINVKYTITLKNPIKNNQKSFNIKEDIDKI